MASSALARRYALSAALKSILAGCLAFAVLALVTGTQLYATATALAGLALLTAWDIARAAAAPHLPDADPGAEQQRRHLAEMERAAALLDAVTVALIAITEDGRIRFANRAARQLAGAVPGSLDDLLVLGPDAAREILALAPGARRILTLPDGAPVLVWSVGLSVPGEPGQKLVSLQRVSGELDAVQLKAWQDMSRVLAHEIMNSLTPIASLSESAVALMAASGEGDGKVAHAVGAIARRSLHLLDFVERYRDLADLPEPRMRTIGAAELVGGIETVLSADFTARGIGFTRTIEPPDLLLHGDPELLSQAIINLLHNAAEAVAAAGAGAASGAPAILLSCHETGKEIVFAVADNGPGIPADRLQEIFVPFFTTKTAGSGIGLTLTRQIALVHGGRIEAINQPGGGALFRIRLPMSTGFGAR